MEIPVNPAWEYSVHQVTKSKATMHASDMRPMSAIFGLGMIVWSRMFAAPKAALCLHPNRNTGSCCVARHNRGWCCWRKGQGILKWPCGSRGAVDNGNPRALAEALHPSEVPWKSSASYLFVSVRLELYQSRGVADTQLWNTQYLPLVSSPEECSAVSNPHALPKRSRAVKQCVSIASLTSPGAAGMIFPEDCSKVSIC